MSTETPALLDALDLPSELHAVQNAYWEARREWSRLDEAYRLVITDILERVDQPEDAPA